MESLLECRNLTKKYGAFTALNNLNLTLNSGRIIGLLGPNGSGKSTLLKMINGLLVPTHGDIKMAGSLIGPSSRELISYLPERTYLPSSETVASFIDFFNDFYSDFDRAKANEMLSHLSINPKAKLKTLSKGNKEKVQLILVMSRNARLYCLDEPIGGVDPAAREYILNTIMKNYNPTASILISTHLIEDIEDILDDVIFIQNGNLILYSPAEELRRREGKTVDALFREVFRC
ncbi:MAG: ABC transporter ATP-binding protein [bacterium]|nr:ABC transporter ATP-binding protein [bacterium]